MAGSAKFAVLSPVLPPYSSGQAVMLYRLLEPFPADQYCLLSCYRPEIVGKLKTATTELPGETFRLKTFSKPNRFIGSLFGLLTEAPRYGLDIIYRARQIRKIIKQQGVTTLIVCSGDFADMAAAYLVKKNTAIHLVPYMFDYFSQQQTGLFRRVSTWLERLIVSRAATVIAPNEFLAKEFAEAYGSTSTIIRNPCHVPALKVPKKPEKAEFSIVYTGAIYDAHFDAMRRLVEALKSIPQAKLHIYTAQPLEELYEQGIEGDQVVFHQHLPQEEMPKVQQAADLLYLPLSFEKTFEVIIRTSAPGKMGEYLAIGRPILAHVPKDSFVEWYLQENQCGFVVANPDRGELVQAVEKFMNDKELSERLAKNGRAVAERDFALPAVQKAFQALTADLLNKRP